MKIAESAACKTPKSNAYPQTATDTTEVQVTRRVYQLSVITHDQLTPWLIQYLSLAARPPKKLFDLPRLSAETNQHAKDTGWNPLKSQQRH